MNNYLIPERRIQTAAILFISLLFIACHVQKQTKKTGLIPQLQLNAPQEGNTSIVYLTFNMTLVDSVKDEYTFQKLNSQQTPGILKKSPPIDKDQADPLYLYYETRDSKNIPLEFFKVQNPLTQSFEYSSEQGRLDKMIFRKTSAELIIRFQISSRTKYLVISKKDSRTLKLKPIYHAAI